MTSKSEEANSILKDEVRRGFPGEISFSDETGPPMTDDISPRMCPEHGCTAIRCTQCDAGTWVCPECEPCLYSAIRQLDEAQARTEAAEAHVKELEGELETNRLLTEGSRTIVTIAIRDGG